ncbi:unnamed protein product [Didymodactylos carnosus]|uniref:Cytidyltransferase-like domain-containing protein n=1 Tax=Didymodactylos carnosus TaxID=1234261 RepID=A0A814SNS7_9BILA|nr:unnamed protein product [Didymodactylos carnosus]CAF1299663.1 unnamed protein product [Didymodactylos carnosus]CAF3914433.1 unnamed protein product [Didymodactylos carnosus]CAF4105616.1 unnamed protein product [Didymodactylos carnosus]
MHSDKTTNIAILRSNVRDNQNENVVLLKTGSLNPVHRTHISNLVQTKEYLERVYSFNVLGGYISPTHDEYVRGKLQNEFISSKHRIEMCEKAIEESGQESWLSVDRAECMASGFIDFERVSCSLYHFINDKLKLPKSVRVIYVSGLDLFNRCNGIDLLRNLKMGVAVVYRPEQRETLIKQLAILDKNVFYVPIDDETKKTLVDISSTLIRKNFNSNEECEHLTYTSVLNYLRLIRKNQHMEETENEEMDVE